MGDRAHKRPGDGPVLICGPLCNFDTFVAEVLLKYGVECIVVRDRLHGELDLESLPGPVFHLTPSHIRVSSDPWDFYRHCKGSSCIISITGALSGFFGKLWPVVPFLPLPPIVTIATGSDITELATERSLIAAVYRALLRRATINFIPPYPTALENADRLGYRNFRVSRYPYLVGPSPDRSGLAGHEGQITYLHASHLDWGKHNSRPGRNSTKGSDRFLRAFISALRDGANVRCIILDRGPDREEARRLVDRSGFTDRFEWRPETNQRGLLHLIRQADVVADQFDVGGFGAIAIEAMAQGRPLLTYLDEAAYSKICTGPVPILNCRTEEQIRARILQDQDRESLSQLGTAAMEWARRVHSTEGDFSDFAATIRSVATRSPAAVRAAAIL